MYTVGTVTPSRILPAADGHLCGFLTDEVCPLPVGLSYQALYFGIPIQATAFPFTEKVLISMDLLPDSLRRTLTHSGGIPHCIRVCSCLNYYALY